MRRKPSLQWGLDAQRPLAEGDPIGRGYKVRTPKASLGLRWSGLLFDILPDDFQRRTAAGGCEIAAAPEHILPVPLLKLRELLAEQSTGNALEAIDQLRDFNAWREVDQQMHMIGFAIELSEFNMEALANAGKYLPHRFDMNAVEDPPSILRCEDQMGMKLKDAMASRAILGSGFWHSTPIVNLMA